MKTRILTKLAVVSLAAIITIGIGSVKSTGNNVLATDNIMNRYIILHDQTTIDQKRDERDQARADAAAAQQRVNELSGQAGSLRGELAELNRLSDEQYAQYEIISGQLAEALIEKANALDEYCEAQDNLEAAQNQFSERVSVMFEYQNKSTLEILLESDSIAGFFTNMEIIALIADSDNQAIDMMTVALDDAQLKSDQALAEAESLQGIIEEKQAQLRELESRIGVTTEALNDVNTQISYYEQQEDELNALAAELDRQIAQLQAEQAAAQAAAQAQAAQQSSGGVNAGTTTAVQGNGTLNWPTWTTYVTSYYGNRVHPVYGTTRFHSGIDIGAGYGDAVMAAAGGTVIYVEEPVPGCNTGGSGYGNYVIIDHGNGLSTLYAHMRDVYVSNGSYVSAGTCIGEVGSTGTSTGAHLHFEVRVNGSTVDPLSYL